MRKLARLMFHLTGIQNVLPRKWFRCGSEDHMIEKCPKPPKDNEKQGKQVPFNEKINRVCNNGEDNDDHNIYASMARMSDNDERKNGEYGDSLQLTNWILDSGGNVPYDPRSYGFHSRIIRRYG